MKSGPPMDLCNNYLMNKIVEKIATKVRQQNVADIQLPSIAARSMSQLKTQLFNRKPLIGLINEMRQMKNAFAELENDLQ